MLRKRIALVGYSMDNSSVWHPLHRGIPEFSEMSIAALWKTGKVSLSDDTGSVLRIQVQEIFSEIPSVSDSAAFSLS